MRSILDLTNNLEEDLYNSEVIVKKSKANYCYTQNLYAAMCNNQFQRNHFWLILKDERWSCTWRYAGGIAANLMGNNGDYMDFYCSGIGFWDKEGVVDDRSVPEGMITDEIRADLKSIGWNVIEESEYGKL